MKIQSMSIVVPNRSCINNCAFCVSRMRCDQYPDNIGNVGSNDYNRHLREYKKRMAFARDNGCNTIMLTGTSEPQQNRSFLQLFGSINRQLSKPFRWVEMQTTGALLDDEYLNFLRDEVEVNTISLSLSSFNDIDNAQINGTPEKLMVNIKELCGKIKEKGFTLRLSLNLNNAAFDIPETPENLALFHRCRDLGADQLTLRMLYSSNEVCDQNTWIMKNRLAQKQIDNLKFQIILTGNPLQKLEFGATKFSFCGMSVVVDDDCMAKTVSDDLKYVILQPDCKLYSHWDDPASLIF